MAADSGQWAMGNGQGARTTIASLLFQLPDRLVIDDSYDNNCLWLDDSS